jgi:hypothetical protein
LKPAVRTGSSGLVLAAFLFLALPAPAEAEWQFTPFLGYTFKGSTTLVDWESAADDVHWNFGGAVTLIGESPVGVEAYYVRTPGFFQSESGSLIPEVADVTASRMYAFMGNVVLATPRSWNRYGLRPFLSGGVGAIHASYDERALAARVNVAAMNLGGGAVGFLTERVGLRFDLRYFRNIRGVSEEDADLAPTLSDEPVRLRYFTISIGVVFKY